MRNLKKAASALAAICILGMVGLVVFEALGVDPVSSDSEPGTAPAEVSRPVASSHGAGSAQTAAFHETTGMRVAAEQQGAVGREFFGTCNGSLRVVDAKGVHLPSPRGYLLWELFDHEGNSVRATAAVQQDVWSFECEGAELAKVLEIVWSDDSRSLLAEFDDVMIPCEHLVDYSLEARLVAGVRLRIVDAEDGNDLQELYYAEALVDDSLTRTRPYPPSSIARRAAASMTKSPVRIPRRKGTVVGWVGAPGYSWRRFAFPGEVDSEVVLPLKRAGTLRVVFDNIGEVVSLRPVLSVYELRGVDGELSADLPTAEIPLDGESELVLDGLGAGAYRLVVRPATSRGLYSPLLALRNTLLPAGAQEVCSMTLARDGLGPGMGGLSVSVGGAGRGVGLPAGQRVLIERQTESESLGQGRVATTRYLSGCPLDEHGVAHFDVSGLAPGPYRVAVLPLGLATTATVEAGQLTAVKLRARRLGLLELTVFREGDTRALCSPMVSFRPAGMGSPAAWKEVHPDYDARVYPIRAVPGDYSVAVSRDGYATRVQRLRIGRDPRAEQVMLEPLPDVELRLVAKQGALPLPLPMDFWTHVHVADAAGRGGIALRIDYQVDPLGGVVAEDATGISVRLSAAGDYRVSFPSYPGLPDFEDRVLRVESGGVAECVIRPFPLELSGR